MSKGYFGLDADQAPRNSELGELAYWDFKILNHLYKPRSEIPTSTISTESPTGGEDGDIWYEVE